MGALDSSAFDAVFKVHYSKKKIHAMADVAGPFYAMVSKNKSSGGKYHDFVFDYENPRGGSATFAKALANRNPSLYQEARVTMAKNYQIAHIDNFTIEASMTDENAFFKALGETDKAVKAAARRDAWQAYRAKGGAKGVVANSNVTTTVLTLTDKADAFNFQVGDVLTADTVNGGGTEHSGTLTVASVDHSAGTVTMTANLDTGISAIGQGDFIFAEGDYGLNMAGIESWLPVDGRAAALAASFFNVTRDDYPDRLGGIYRDSSGEPLDQAFIKLTASVAKHSEGVQLTGFLNPEQLSDLVVLLGSKVQYIERVTKRAGVGFKGVEVAAGGTTVQLFGDANCPENRMYVLDMDTWELVSTGPGTPHILDRDGILQRASDADEYQVRVAGYRNLICTAPVRNGVALLGDAS